MVLKSIKFKGFVLKFKETPKGIIQSLFKGNTLIKKYKILFKTKQQALNLAKTEIKIFLSKSRKKQRQTLRRVFNKRKK